MHVLIHSSGLSHLQRLAGGRNESELYNKNIDEGLYEWTDLGTFGKVKRAAEDRKR